MNVTIYSKPGCPQCKATKQRFAQRGIAFQECDITQDSAARQDLVDRGFRSAPVVITDAASWAGYRPDLIDAT